jgi:hypothetical protein
VGLAGLFGRPRLQDNCKVVRSSGFSRLFARYFRLKAGLRTTGSQPCNSPGHGSGFLDNSADRNILTFVADDGDAGDGALAT